MISGAVALKELRGFSRRWTSYLLRGLFVGAAVLVLWSWRSELVQAVANPSEYAHVGRRIFNSLSLLQMLAVLLSALLAGSDLLTSELRGGTLNLLVLTPLSLRRVVFGKWLAAVLQSLSILLAGAPALAMGVFLGGVDPEQMAIVLGATVSLAMLCAALAVRASAVARTPVRAFFSALLSFIVFYLALVLLQFLLVQWVGFDLSMIRITQVVFLALPVPVAWLLLLHAVRRARLRLLKNDRTSGLERDEAFETKGSYYSPRLIISAGVWENRPLLWKELATRAAGRISPTWKAVLLVLAVLLTALLCMASGGRDSDLVFVAGGVFLLAALAQGASLFASENTGRRWDMLLTTPLAPRDIVHAKLAAGVVAREALLLLGLLAVSLVVFTHRAPGIGVVAVPLTCLSFLVFAYALAAACSLHARSSRTAFLASGGLVAALLFLPPLIAPENFALADFSGRAVLALSPVALIEAHFWDSGRTPEDVLGLYFVLHWSASAVASLFLVGLASRRLRAVAATM